MHKAAASFPVQPWEPQVSNASGALAKASRSAPARRLSLFSICLLLPPLCVILSVREHHQSNHMVSLSPVTAALASG